MHNDTIKKSWYKRWWAIVLYVFIGLIILGVIFGGNDTSNSGTQTPSDSSGIKATQGEAQTYALGDSIKAGDFTWKITKVTFALDGSVESTGVASGVAWNDRLTATYL